MIDENKFLDAFGDIDDEFLLEEYDNYNKSKKIIRFEKYLNKAQNIAQKIYKYCFSFNNCYSYRCSIFQSKNKYSR